MVVGCESIDRGRGHAICVIVRCLCSASPHRLRRSFALVVASSSLTTTKPRMPSRPLVFFFTRGATLLPCVCARGGVPWFEAARPLAALGPPVHTHACPLHTHQSCRRRGLVAKRRRAAQAPAAANNALRERGKEARFRCVLGRLCWGVVRAPLGKQHQRHQQAAAAAALGGVVVMPVLSAAGAFRWLLGVSYGSRCR